MPTKPLKPDSPPAWLLDVCREHRPMKRGDKDVCQSLLCTDMYSFTRWTPEHLAEVIHNCLAQAIQKLITEGNQ